MVLRTLEQSLGSYWIHLETMKASYQHVLQLFPRCDRSWAKGRIPRLSHAPNCHDKGFCHDIRITTI
jgi:hypothetical protein